MFTSSNAGWPSAQPGPSSGVLDTRAGSAVAPSGKLDFDSNAPLRVVKGSLLLTLAGAATGASIGVMRVQSGTLLGVQMGTNCFLFAFPFFALREYVVSPFLSSLDPRYISSLPYSVSSSSNPKPPSPLPAQSLPAYTHNVLSSTLSGSLVGGALAAWRRRQGGMRSVLTGVLFFGAASASGQLGMNAFRRGTSRLVGGAADARAERRQSERQKEREMIMQSGYAAGVHGHVPAYAYGAQQAQPPENLSSSSSSSPFGSPTTSTSASPSPLTSSPENASSSDLPSQAQSWSSQIRSTLASMVPVRKLDDAEYEQKLQTRLVHVEQQMQEIEEELKRLESSPSTSRDAGPAGR